MENFEKKENIPDSKDRKIALPATHKWFLKSDLSKFPEYSQEFLEFVSSVENPWFDPDDLALAFDEAVPNAIEHGNGGNAEKEVVVEAEITDEYFKLTVLDQSSDAFDPQGAFNSVDDPSAIEASHGRGISILRNKFDSVEYEFLNPGNRIIIVKRKK